MGQYSFARRDSWPPTILHLNDTDIGHDPDLDHDPISFFLTVPSVYDEDDDDLSAGIESSHHEHPEVREVSPSSLQRKLPADKPLTESWDDLGDGMLSLADFERRWEAREQQSLKDPATKSAPGSSANRGRGVAKKGRGRGQTRSLESRRTRSWRAPSPDVYSIREGDEEEAESGKEVATTSSVAPIEIPKKKKVHWEDDGKKRVHWE